MRAVFVNYCHPQTRHVCAIRLRSFAEVAARRGHKVILLTRSLDDDEPAKSPAQVRGELRAHDWGAPYNLACPPEHSPALAALRAGRLPSGVSKAVVAWYFVTKGGVFADWVEASRRYWRVLSDEFRPEITWGTFGNTDAWRIAQGIARRSECPWVMDVKDSWRLYVPRFLRAHVARRYKDAALVTTISQGHADMVGGCFRQPKTTVYSGFPKAALDSPPPRLDEDAFRISLNGSVYPGEHLRRFVRTLEEWLGRLGGEERARVRLIYAGGSWQEVLRATAGLSRRCAVEVHRYLTLEDLRGIQLSCHVNAYITLSKSTFHHKVFELLCCFRPIICFPGEGDEAKRIVERVRGTLYNCEDEADLLASLERLWRGRKDGGACEIDRALLESYSWERQADVLLNAFTSAARN